MTRFANNSRAFTIFTVDNGEPLLLQHNFHIGSILAQPSQRQRTYAFFAGVMGCVAGRRFLSLTCIFVVVVLAQECRDTVLASMHAQLKPGLRSRSRDAGSLGRPILRV